MFIKKTISKNIPILTIFLVSLLLVLPQLLNHSLVLGGDSNFHFNRLYDTYMQIRTGNFNYFQTNYGFQQSGRIVNALYGPGFSYILGFLLILVHSWIKFQVVTSFILFFISGLSMYCLSRELKTSKNISLMTSILFMGSFWITRWSYNQNFMAWGVMLMPVVVIFGIRMITTDGSSLKIIPFALTVSLLIQIHVLSALMSIIVLVFFFIIGISQSTKKRQLLLKCLSAGILSLLLTFNVWGALLDVYSSNKLYPPYSFPDMSDFTMNISTNNYDIKNIGLFISIIFILQITLVLKKHQTMSLSNKTITFIGFIFLILSSNLIPWTRLGILVPTLQSSLQFPNRFAGFATVLLIAGFGVTISNLPFKDLKKNVELAMMISCVFILMQSYSDLQTRNEVWNSNQSIVSMSNIENINDYNNRQIHDAFGSFDLVAGLNMISKPSPDYLPKHGISLDKGYTAYSQNIVHNQDNVTKRVKGGSLIVTWRAKNKSEKIHLPIIVYSNSLLSLNSHSLSKKQLTFSTLGSPTITSTRVGKNTLVMRYQSKIITKISLSIVLLTWIISFLAMFIFTYSDKKKKSLN